MIEDRLLKEVLLSTPQGIRRRGRPRKSYKDGTGNHMKDRGLTEGIEFGDIMETSKTCKR